MLRLVPLLAVVGVLAGVGEARGFSCGSAVVVNGHALIGAGGVGAVPDRGRAIPAVLPACGSDGPDSRIRVEPLKGVPPEIAVARGRELFLDSDSLVEIRAHPLHRTRFGDRPIDYRKGRRCRREDGVTRGVYAGNRRIRRADRTVFVAIDVATRLTNRPAYEPLRDGQSVALRTSICATRRVADEIAFVGPTVEDDRYTPDFSDDGGGFEVPDWWPVLFAPLGLLIVGAAWHGLRD